jgi:HD-like signal output (HDOD) protein
VCFIAPAIVGRPCGAGKRQVARRRVGAGAAVPAARTSPDQRVVVADRRPPASSHAWRGRYRVGRDEQETSPMLTRAPAHLGGWIQAIGDAEIPILARTAASLATLRRDEDDVAPREIADVVLDDPLMSLKVLSHVSRNRSARMVTDTETVTASLLMMGVSRFFRTFERAPVVEERLRPVPGAVEGLERVLGRAHRAARFALAFAMQRQDTDAEVIQEAAMLHDFAELLLWCHAPLLALEIERRQRAEPSLRSAQVQRDVLNVELCDLEQALMKAWQLPELLQHLTNDHLSGVPRVRNVLLATALARHSHAGWDNPALPDDIAAIGRLLNLAPAAVWSVVRELDETAADAIQAAPAD